MRRRCNLPVSFAVGLLSTLLLFSAIPILLVLLPSTILSNTITNSSSLTCCASSDLLFTKLLSVIDGYMSEFLKRLLLECLDPMI